jgi:surface protein
MKFNITDKSYINYKNELLKKAKQQRIIQEGLIKQRLIRQKINQQKLALNKQRLISQKLNKAKVNQPKLALNKQKPIHQRVIQQRVIQQKMKLNREKKLVNNLKYKKTIPIVNAKNKRIINLKLIERVNKYQKLLRRRKFEELKIIQKQTLDSEEKKEVIKTNEITNAKSIENINIVKEIKEVNKIRGFFSYSFDYTGSFQLTEKLVKDNIPIVTCEYLKMFTKIIFVGKHVLVEIETSLKEMEHYDKDFGITFNKISADNKDESIYVFYNKYTTNLRIISSDNCPFSRLGEQFKNLKNLELLEEFKPYFLPKTSLEKCFYNALNFNSDISNWNTKNVNNMSYMFYSATSFNNGQQLQEIKKLKEIQKASYNNSTKTLTCPNANFNLTMHINDILMIKTNTKLYLTIVQKIKSNISLILLNPFDIDLNQGDIIEIKTMEQSNKPLNWDTSNVTNMELMFYNAFLFNQKINWDVSKVTNMTNMFFQALTFNQDISFWNTQNVTNMASMFCGAINFNNGELNEKCSNSLNWDITNCENLSSMFENCNRFNQDISNWNTVNVKNMEKMFKHCTLFNQYLGNWNTENVESISEMFNNASSFNNGQVIRNITKILPLLSTYIDSTKTLNCPGATFITDLSINDVLIIKTYKDTTFYTFFIKKIVNNTTLQSNNNLDTDLALGQIMSIKKSVIGTNPLNWNTLKMKNMSLVFNNAISFNQNISRWNIENINLFPNMLNNAYSFNNGNKPDISKYI